MFEKASRQKLRFDTSKGQLTVEDLWDLPLSSTTNRVNLNDIAKGLYKQLQSADEISFVSEQKTDDIVQLKFELVKHVIGVRQAKKEAEAKARDNAEQITMINQLIAEKQHEELKGKSVEELLAMRNGLK